MHHCGQQRQEASFMPQWLKMKYSAPPLSLECVCISAFKGLFCCSDVRHCLTFLFKLVATASPINL